MDLESFVAVAREFYEQGRYGALVAHTEVLLDQVPQDGVSPIAEATIRLWRGNGYYSLGRLGRALSCYNEALSLISEEETPVIAAQILTSLMTVYASTPESEEFQDLHNRYLALCRRCPAASKWEPWVYYNRGVCLEWAMELDAAAEAYEACLRTCDATANQPSVADLRAAALCNLAGISLQAGQFDTVWTCLSADQSEWSVDRRAMMQNYEARYYVARGEISKAEVIIRNVKNYCGLSEATTAEFHLTCALCHQSQGDSAAARSAAYQAVDHAYKARPEHAVARDRAVQLLRSLNE